MTDKEKELSLFDQWEAEAEAKEKEAEKRQPIQESAQTRETDPSNIQYSDTQTENIDHALQDASVETKDFDTLVAEASQGLKDAGAQENLDPNIDPYKAPNPVFDQELKEKGADIMIVQAGQALNQADVETQEQTPFGKWEVQAEKQTQSEPEKQQNQEPER